MRLVSVRNLRPGFVVGRPIMDEGGQILLHQGVALTLDYIEALVAKGYGAIYVQDPEDPIYVPPDEDLNPVTRAKAVHALDRVYSAIKDEIGDLREQTFERLKGICHSQAMKSLLGERGPFEALNASTNTILNEVLDRKILAGLTTIKMTDTYLHHHCIDVCVISIMLGQALELSEDHLRQLATGCILHDIGKVFLRQRVAPITEIRQHTLLGYELLRSGENADILAPHVALEHHEYQDGSGEPRGLRGTNTIERNRKSSGPVLTLIGEIAAVANVYDNLLSGSASTPPIPPDHAVQTLQYVAGKQLNQAIVRTFLRMTPVYPLGIEVLVRSGRYRNYTGIVTRIHPDHFDRPVVTLIRDNHGRPIPVIEVNLLEQPQFTIRCKML